MHILFACTFYDLCIYPQIFILPQVLSQDIRSYLYVIEQDA